MSTHQSQLIHHDVQQQCLIGSYFIRLSSHPQYVELSPQRLIKTWLINKIHLQPRRFICGVIYVKSTIFWSLFEYRYRIHVCTCLWYTSLYDMIPVCLQIYPRQLQYCCGYNQQDINSSSPSAAFMRHWDGHYWCRERLVAYSAPSRYLNQ